MRREWDNLTVLITITGFVLAMLLLRPSHMMIGLLAGSLLVLVLPGYAVMAAAFPRSTLAAPERLLLSFGLSVALTALGGLTLNWLPWGLQASSWMVLLGGITVGAGIVARRRRHTTIVLARGGTGLTARQALLLGLAALLAAGAVGVARHGASQQHAPGIAQLWILPSTVGHQLNVRLGVRSLEATVVQYRLQVVVGGQVASEWPTITVEAGATWETTMVLPRKQDDAQTIEVLLYRADAPEVVYRRVVLRLGA